MAEWTWHARSRSSMAMAAPAMAALTLAQPRSQPPYRQEGRTTTVQNLSSPGVHTSLRWLLPLDSLLKFASDSQLLSYM